MSVKIVQRTNKINASEIYPLYLRITENKKTSFISLNINVNVSDWNKKTQRVKMSHPKSSKYNQQIKETIAKVKKIRNTLKNIGTILDSNMIKLHFNNQAISNFLDFCDQFTTKDSGNISYISLCNYKSSIKNFKRFVGKDYIDFSEVTTNYLKKYEDYLITIKHFSTNTVYNNLKVLRRIFNDAIKKGLIPIQTNPFFHYKLKKVDKTKKYLKEQEVWKIEKLSYTKKSSIEHHKKMFLFSCYTGLRISDIKNLKWENIVSERIVLNGNTRLQQVKMINKAIQIINFYKFEKNIKLFHRIFPFYSETYINKHLKVIAKDANINKVLSFNIARNTFAVTAIKKGIRLDIVSKLLGHKNLQSINSYVQTSSKDIDMAIGTLNTKI